MERREGIPKTMKAVVCYGPMDYRLEEVKTPEINEDEVLVKIIACGICAGDIKSYRGAAMFWGGGSCPHGMMHRLSPDMSLSVKL